MRFSRSVAARFTLAIPLLLCACPRSEGDLSKVKLPDHGTGTANISDTPESIFQRIEENVRTARTIRVEFDRGSPNRSDPGWCGADRTGAWGMLLIGERGRLLLSDRSSASTSVVEHLLVSNGSTLRQGMFVIKQGARTATSQGTREQRISMTRIENSRMLLARVGVGCLSILADSTTTEMDVRQRFQVSDFKNGPVDDNGQSITYALTVSHPQGRSMSEVTLWYDPSSFKPLKRRESRRLAEGRMITEEVYSTFTYNDQIADEEFLPQLPE